MVKLVAAGKGVSISNAIIMRHVIALTGKVLPKVVYFGTPSLDKEENWRVTGLPYEKAGCSVSRINLWQDFNITEESKYTTRREVEDHLSDADVILVSGGSCATGVARWKELGIDELLMTAATRQDGPVLAGGSAGALCWFGRGLGLVPALCVPHFDNCLSSNGVSAPDVLLQRYPAFPSCICIDEDAAFVIEEEEATVISANAESKCYLMTQDSSPLAQPLEVGQVRKLRDLDIYLSSTAIWNQSRICTNYDRDESVSDDVAVVSVALMSVSSDDVRSDATMESRPNTRASDELNPIPSVVTIPCSDRTWGIV